MAEDDSITELLARAENVREKSYSPYSRHPVGAAIRSNTGQIYVGTNVEIATYKTICAEASAISSMVSNGEYEIEEIAIVGPGEVMCWPCGDCRQRIFEFSKKDINIISTYGNRKEIEKIKLSYLLPYAFGPDKLNL